MNPEIKEQWLAALRGGEYPQTTGNLHDSHGYCCLGVLCDLGVRAGVVGTVAWGEDDIESYDRASSFLPDAVVAWAGVDSDNPEAQIEEDGGGFVYRELADLNDRGATFAEIADLIEEQL